MLGQIGHTPSLRTVSDIAADISGSGDFADARLLEGTLDLCAVVGPHHAMLRRVLRATPADHTALATMMTSGECVWAGIVYSEREGSETTGWVETFHVSELDQLVERLRGLQRILGGESSAPSSASASSSGSSSPSSAAGDGV